MHTPAKPPPDAAPIPALAHPTVAQREDRSGTRPVSCASRHVMRTTTRNLFWPARRPAPVYTQMVNDLKSKYKISIRKWRSSMSGIAYELTYADGRIKRLISAPRPRSPVSAAIFLHEVGHHAIGFRRYPLRCQEEFYVWQWTFREMAARQIPIDARVLKRYRQSMHHYATLAHQHNHPVPHDLAHFTLTPN